MADGVLSYVCEREGKLISGADTFQFRLKKAMMELPAKRGIDIPADEHDVIRESADGLTLPLWGRHATPQQIQALYDGGHHTPEAVQQALSQLPHPHAPSMSLAEFEKWQKATHVFQQHSKGRQQ